MSSEKIQILYIDDEVHNLNAFKATFRRSFHIFTAETTREADKILSENTVQVIISDQRMPGETGVEFFERILNIYPDPMRILLTGYADITAVIDSINKGQIYRYLTKPWNADELEGVITAAAEVYNLRKENKELTRKLFKANEQLEFLLRQQLLS